MKILAFSSSNNRHSINRILAEYTAHLVAGAEVDVLNIHGYELPIYSEDREAEMGKPKLARDFLDRISAADALVIAHAEHNGTFTAAYKNLMDWASRQAREVFQNKPTLLLATSPGLGGARSVLSHAQEASGYQGAELVDAISVPSFHEHFSLNDKEITDVPLKAKLASAADQIRVAVLRQRERAAQ